MNEFYIRLTDAAIEAFNQKIEARNTPHTRIRLGLRGGGCKGFNYVIQFDDDKPRDKDLEFFYNGVRVVVDNKSILHLNGCTLDWEKTLMQQGFKFINSNEKSRCNCGSSVDL
jgi:iron-sulfur cluster assembly protein